MTVKNEVNEMYDFEMIRRQLEDCSLTKVAKRTELTYPTLKRLMLGATNFNVATMDKLCKYIEDKNNIK
jgi:hypothetical protein